MRRYQLSIVILVLVLLAGLSDVEGQYMQYPMAAGGYTMPSATLVNYPTTNQTSQAAQPINVSPNSQYYTMGSAPNTHLSTPQQISIESNIASTVYFRDQRKPMAYSQYKDSPTYRINSLWIKGSDNWTQYAEVPLGAIVSLLAISPNGGNGHIKEMRDNGQMKNYDYFFYPNSLLTYYADTIGRHRLSYSLAGQPSNHIAIDVIGTYKPSSNYYPPRYYNPYYYGNYPIYYGYYPYCGPNCAYYVYWGWDEGWPYGEYETYEHHGEHGDGHGGGDHGGHGDGGHGNR